jgi:hypothetical protein
MIPSYSEDPDLLPDFLEVCEMANLVGNVGELKNPARHGVGAPSGARLCDDNLVRGAETNVAADGVVP